MITENYVSFETAKLLKEKGFEGKMHTFYTEKGTEMESAYVVPSNFFPIYRPTLQMAMKWLREVHNLFIQVTIVPHTTVTMEQKYYVFAVCKDRRNLAFRSDHPHDSYSTYEEACEAAIKYCLENLI